MNEDLRRQLERLEREVAELAQASKRALGFTKTIEYKGIAFSASRRFVIADLTPLAFFHLVEPIGEEGTGKAIMQLHERLVPLLTCRHEWSLLKRSTDKHIQAMSSGAGSSRAYVCKACTAYALGEPLPEVGRKMKGDL